jgi:hypothetical protein
MCHELTSPMQCCSNEKAARRRLFNSNLMIADQAAINAGADLRRYSFKYRSRFIPTIY